MHKITRSGVTVEVDAQALPEAIVDQLVLHGLTQKVGDAAAGAVSEAYDSQGEEFDWAKADAKAKEEFRATQQDRIHEHAKAAMEKVIAQLMAGEWASSARGTGMTPTEKRMVSLLREQVRKLDEQWYKNAKESERVARIREVIAKLKPKQHDSLRDTAEAQLAAEAKEREAASKALAGIEVSL